MTAAVTRRAVGPWRQRRRRPVAATALLAAVTALGLALRLYQLTRPGYLLGVTEYDDGVYLGSALRLVHGMLPYRDYAFVQPPGITVLMAPVGLLANAMGTARAMVVARIATCCAGAAAVPLVGRLARPAGTTAVVAAAGVTAVYPAAVTAAHTLMLEPWSALGCVIGMTAVFDNARWASTRRMGWGGVAFGAAAAIKLWALVPGAVVVVLCLRRPRRAAWYLAGAAAGFLIPTAPFALIAPRAFVRDVAVAQLTRAATAAGPTYLPHRLASLAGLDDFTLRPGQAAGLAVVIAALIAAGWACRGIVAGRLDPLDRFVLASAVAVAAMFCRADDFYYHYAAFFCPFLALAVALPAGTLGRLVRWRAGRDAATVVAATAVVAMAAVGLHTIGSWTVGTYKPWGRVWVPPARVVRLIPPGACLVTESPQIAILADRFFAASPRCPVVDDSYGTLMALTDGTVVNVTHRNVPVVTRFWDADFSRAAYVWLNEGWRTEITQASMDYLRHHFRLIAAVDGSHLYARRA